MRGTVVRYGDADMTASITDGMAAVKFKRELDSLKMKLPKLELRSERYSEIIAENIRDADDLYGFNPVHSRIYNATLGFYGLIVWAIHAVTKRLQAKNREA